MSFEDEIEKQGVEPFGRLTITLPTKGKIDFATRAINPKSTNNLGLLSRILSLGQFKRSFAKRGGRVERNQVSIILDNADLFFSKLFAPHNENNPKNANVAFQVGTLAGGFTSNILDISLGNVDSFSIRDHKYNLATSGGFSLTTTPKVPRIGDLHPSGVLFWPDAFPGHLSRLFPAVFGKIDSTGLSLVNPAQGGPWPLTFVNNKAGNFIFIATVGKDGESGAKSTVQTIYKNGQPLDLFPNIQIFTQVTIDSLIGGGITDYKASGFTLTDTADFTDANGNLSVMSCDVTGAVNTENPIQALAALLSDFLLDSGQGLDSASFAEMELVADARQWCAAGGVIKDASSEAILADFVNTFDIRLFLGFDGQLEISIVQPELDPPGADKIIDDLGHMLSPPAIDFATADMLTKVSFLFGRHDAIGEFSFAGSVEDPATITRYDHNRSTELKMPWTRDETTAKDVASRRLEINKNAQIKVAFEMGLRGASFQVADAIGLTLLEFPDTSLSAGVVERLFEIQSATLNIMNGKTSFLAETDEIAETKGSEWGESH